MPEWVKTIGNALVRAIPGLITAIVTGVAILVIEYRTGWFANHTPGVIAAKERGEKVERVGMSIKPILNFIGMIIAILIFILTVGSVLYFITQSGLSETTLDNPTDTNTVVVKIKEGSTASIFDNSLFITVNEYIPPNRIDSDKGSGVNFIVGAVNFENLNIENAEVGSVFHYKAKTSYSIRIGSVNSGFTKHSVDFIVTKLEESSP